MFRNRSASAHQFSMIPRADIPRSTFNMESSYKTTINAGYLYPVYVEEVLPGDSFSVSATLFGRLATPITPFIDNLYLDTFFFFVPNRLIWDYWQRFCGERDAPGDSIDFTVPQVVSPMSGFAELSIYDYFGIPCAGQIAAGQTISVNALPLRAYNLIWNEWFRDQNLQQPVAIYKANGTDVASDYQLLRRGKRHDYFTSCLPWTQKGDSVTLPLGSVAPVRPYSSGLVSGAQSPIALRNASTGADITTAGDIGVSAGGALQANTTGIGTGTVNVYFSNLGADLSEATAATINQIRQAFQIQKLLERDARGGTRYTEVVRSHFGVLSPDARLQRPEYLGGGSTPVGVREVPQTGLGDTSAGDSPLGWVTGQGSVVARNGFTQSFTEHGYVIGLVSVRADLTYQQGLHKMWQRKTRYDFYWPVFAHLGEQPVKLSELWCTGVDVSDEKVFGYQERWAEYRYKPSQITGMLRSSYSTPLDLWHLAQDFQSEPALNGIFIQENPPVDRVIATKEQTGDQFVLDILFKNRVARPLPMYSVPGLVDHF